MLEVVPWFANNLCLCETKQVCNTVEERNNFKWICGLHFAIFFVWKWYQYTALETILLPTFHRMRGNSCQDCDDWWMLPCQVELQKLSRTSAALQYQLETVGLFLLLLIPILWSAFSCSQYSGPPERMREFWVSSGSNLLLCAWNPDHSNESFHVVLFIMLYKVVLTFKSVDETLVCDHSNESYWAVPSHGVLHGMNF